MKKFLATLAIAVTSAVSCTPAQAAFFNGNKLLALYKGDDAEQLMAKAYIIGVADAYNGNTFCPSRGIATQQLFDLSIAFIQNNPAVRDQAADVLIEAAIAPIWPCAKKPTSTTPSSRSV